MAERPIFNLVGEARFPESGYDHDCEPADLKCSFRSNKNMAGAVYLRGSLRTGTRLHLS
jgi:hypothetical protein